MRRKLITEEYVKKPGDARFYDATDKGKAFGIIALESNSSIYSILIYSHIVDILSIVDKYIDTSTGLTTVELKLIRTHTALWDLLKKARSNKALDGSSSENHTALWDLQKALYGSSSENEWAYPSSFNIKVQFRKWESGWRIE
jgi:hypothetical protein